jgi:hypothetical protein
MATTDARLIRLADEGRLATDVEFARHSLLALSNGATMLWTQGSSKTEVRAVGRFLLDATLSAVVRAKPEGMQPNLRPRRRPLRLT